jgi:hypothetical protein
MLIQNVLSYYGTVQLWGVLLKADSSYESALRGTPHNFTVASLV